MPLCGTEEDPQAETGILAVATVYGYIEWFCDQDYNQLTSGGPGAYWSCLNLVRERMERSKVTPCQAWDP